MPSDERHKRILDAAESCFAQAGFHRSTMADIAVAAKMSAGNLYRYFNSKDAVVAQLCARDRAEIAGGFAQIQHAENPFSAFEALGKHHLVDEPRQHAVLVAEIWSEATRNPEIAKLCSDFDVDISARFVAFLTDLKNRGLMKSNVDYHQLTELVIVLVDGVISRRARDPAFDPAPFVGRIMDIVRAASVGALPSLLSRENVPLTDNSKSD